MSLSYISKDLFSGIIKSGIDRGLWKKKEFLISLADFKVRLTSADQIEIDNLAQTIFAKNVEGINKQGFSSNKYLDYLIQEDMIIIVDKQLIHKHVLLDCIKNYKCTLHKIHNWKHQSSKNLQVFHVNLQFLFWNGWISNHSQKDKKKLSHQRRCIIQPLTIDQDRLNYFIIRKLTYAVSLFHIDTKCFSSLPEVALSHQTRTFSTSFDADKTQLHIRVKSI